MTRSLFGLLAIVSALSLHAGNIRVEVKEPAGAPVSDAVASLMPLDKAPQLTPPAEPVVIVQDKEEFQPYVTAIVAGTRVNFPNRDKIAHHVFSQSKAREFEIPRYRGAAKETILFDKPGVVALGCNLHDWMLAYVFVLATPYYGVSGGDGLVQLTSLPAGRYRLEVWHPRVKELVTREVTLDANNSETQVISVMLRPDKRLRRAPESDVGGYK
jgi:plastocyanin